MKNLTQMRSLVLITLLTLFMMPLLGQQRPGDGQGRPPGPGPGGRGQFTEEDVKQRIETLAKTLECTDKQKKDLLDYEITSYRKMQTEREKFASGSGDFDRESFRARMQEQRQLRDEKYKEILTEAQMAKYNQLMEERRQDRQQQWDNRQGGGENTQRQRGRGGN